MVTKLRPYQQKAFDACIGYLKSDTGNGLVVCPTGSGKSVIIGHLCETLLRVPETRILLVSHVQEILTQNIAALERTGIAIRDIGIYSASLGIRRHRRVTVAAIQSIFRKPEIFRPTYILIDEAHMIPNKKKSMYRRLLLQYPNARILGFTATPFRTKTGLLFGTAQSIFNKVIYSIDVVQLIQERYLSPLLTRAAHTIMDTAKITKVAGDYSQKELSESFDKEQITTKIVNELKQYQELYKHWLIFAIDIKHCEHITTLLNEIGIKAVFIHSRMTDDRQQIIREYKDGVHQALVSVATMTTGFDFPKIDLIILLRPTMSPILHVQQIGRGLRIAPGKKHCCILDFAGNLERLGPINEACVTEGKESNKKGVAPIKMCSKCRTYVPLSAAVCYICGFEFPPPPPKLETKASKADVISMQLWVDVQRVSYQAYKIKRITYLQVVYSCPLLTVKYLINPYSGTQARRKSSREWWRKHTHNRPLPKSIDDIIDAARAGDILESTKIRVNTQNWSNPKIIEFG